MKNVESSQQVPILHGISREHYTMHATQLFIDRSGVPHVDLKCAPCMGHTRQKKCSFQIDCKIFSEGHCFHVLAWYCVYWVALLCDKFWACLGL